MTKLQKRLSPAYPSLNTNTISLEGGIPYESLSHDTKQPLPLMAGEDYAHVSGALGSNNPYNSTAQYQPPAFQVLSPVSPMDPPRNPRASNPPTHIHAPEPHRQSMNARKSVELRRLDGTPYDVDQAKKVKVAQDMHEGVLPPAYKRTSSEPFRPTDSKMRSNNVTPSQSRTGSTPNSRITSQEYHSASRAATAVPTSPTAAGPSAMPQQRRCCDKCGKKKRSATASVEQQQQQYGGSPTLPNSAALPGVRLSRPPRPGVSVQQAPAVRGINPQIDVIPPSASTYRPPPSSYREFGDRTPLVAKSTQQDTGFFGRSSSLVRSLSRRLSGRSKRVSDGPLPSQQLRASQANDEQGNGTLINMISKAINDSGDDNNNSQYARLGVKEQPSRPTSPFSFVETPNETEGYEMDDRSYGKEKATSPTSPDFIYSPGIIEETLDVDVDRRSRQMKSRRTASGPGGLNVPGAQQEVSRPPITRFKSLRQGVNRAASVTRSTSLRRLESLKTVHTAWYRDDMAIEGHNGDAVPVY